MTTSHSVNSRDKRKACCWPALRPPGVPTPPAFSSSSSSFSSSLSSSSSFLNTAPLDLGSGGIVGPNGGGGGAGNGVRDDRRRSNSMPLGAVCELSCSPPIRGGLAAAPSAPSSCGSALATVPLCTPKQEVVQTGGGHSIEGIKTPRAHLTLEQLLGMYFAPLVTYREQQCGITHQPLWWYRRKAMEAAQFEKNLTSTLNSGLYVAVDESYIFLATLISAILQSPRSVNLASFSTLPLAEQKKLVNMSTSSQEALSVLFTLILRDNSEFLLHVGHQLVKTGRYTGPLCGESLVTLQLNGFPAFRETIFVEFSYTNFSGVELRGLNFTSLSLCWCDFTNSKLDGCQFQCSCLDGACLSQSVVHLADFTGASLIRTNFTRSQADSAIFDWTNMFEADLSQMCSERAQFKCSYLGGALLHHAILKRANFSEASMGTASLLHCNLKNAILTGTQGLTVSQLREAATVFQAHIPAGGISVVPPETLEHLKQELKFDIDPAVPLSEEQQYSWISDFLSSESQASNDGQPPSWVGLKKKPWNHEPQWNGTPTDTIYNMEPDEELWRVVETLVHCTSDTLSYRSKPFEFARMKKAADTGRLLAFLQQEAKHPPIHTGEVESISIKEIKVVKNLQLWKQYQGAKKAIAEDLTSRGIQVPLNGVGWHSSLCGLPVLNSHVGECWLFHGASQYIVQLITKGGFSTKFSTRKMFTGYGALGKGIYLSDSFGKVSTYVTCPKCGNNCCLCTDKTQSLKVMLLCRVLLGHVFVDKHKEHKFEELVPEGYHSSWGPYAQLMPDSAFQSNEFRLDSSQVYPEMCIFYQDNSPVFRFDVQIPETKIPAPDLWAASLGPIVVPVTDALKDFYRLMLRSKDIVRREALLTSIEQACSKVLLNADQRVQLAISELQQRVMAERNECRTSLLGPSIPESERIFCYVTQRGASFSALQQWGKAIEQYKTALQIHSHDANLCLSYAVASYKFQEDKKETITYLNRAFHIEPKLALHIYENEHFCSQLAVTNWSLDLISQGHTDPLYHEEWLRRTFCDMHHYCLTGEISLIQCEDFYWQFDWDTRQKMLSTFSLLTFGQDNSATHQSLSAWILDILEDRSGNHMRVNHLCSSWSLQFSELFSPPPISNEKVVVSWVDRLTGQTLTRNLKPNFVSSLFNNQGYPNCCENNISTDQCLVVSLEEENRLIAQCKFYPRYPFRQYAADELTYSLSGYGPITTLAKIIHPMRSGQPYPVLFYMPLGEALHQKHTNMTKTPVLHKKAFSWKLFETLLLQPEGDRVENLSLYDGWILGLNNESILPKVSVQDNVTKVSSIIFFFPEMSMPINQHVSRAFEQLDPCALLTEWGMKLERYNTNLNKLFSENQISLYRGTQQGSADRNYNCYCNLSALFRSQDITKLACRMVHMQELLKSPASTSWTHQQFLSFVEPQLAACFEAIRTDLLCPSPKVSVLVSCLWFMRFDKCEDEYLPVVELKDTNIAKTVDTYRQIFCVYHLVQENQDITPFKTTSDDVREAVFNSLDWIALGPKYSQVVLQTCADLRIPFTKLSISFNQQLSAPSLCSLLSASIQVIKLTSCPFESSLLGRICELCSSLTTLQLEELDQLSQICESTACTTFSPTTQWQTLQTLVVLNCKNLVQVTLTQIPKLSSFEVRNCFKLQNINLVISSGSLEFVHLENCHALQNVSITSPEAFVNMKSLQVLSCPQLEVDGFTLPVPVLQLRTYNFKDQSYYVNRYKVMISTLFSDFRCPLYCQDLIATLFSYLRGYKICLHHESRKVVDTAIQNLLLLRKNLVSATIPTLFKGLNDKDNSVQSKVMTVWHSALKSSAHLISPQIISFFFKGSRVQQLHNDLLVEALGSALAYNVYLNVDICTALLQLLGDSNSGIRCRSIKVIAKANISLDAEWAQRLQLAILNALEDESSDVRGESIHAWACLITSFKEPSDFKRVNNFSHFFRALSDSNKRVCSRAIRAFTKVMKYHPSRMSETLLFRFSQLLIAEITNESWEDSAIRVSPGRRALAVLSRLCSEQLFQSMRTVLTELLNSENLTIKRRAALGITDILKERAALFSPDSVSVLAPLLLKSFDSTEPVKALGELVRSCSQSFSVELLRDILVTLLKLVANPKATIFDDWRKSHVLGVLLSLFPLLDRNGIDWYTPDLQTNICSLCFEGGIFTKAKAAEVMEYILSTDDRLSQIMPPLLNALGGNISSSRCGAALLLEKVTQQFPKIVNSVILAKMSSALQTALQERDENLGQLVKSIGEVLRLASNFITTETLLQMSLMLFQATFHTKLAKPIPVASWGELVKSLSEDNSSFASQICRVLCDSLRERNQPLVYAAAGALKHIVTLSNISPTIATQILQSLIASLLAFSNPTFQEEAAAALVMLVSTRMELVTPEILTQVFRVVPSFKANHKSNLHLCSLSCLSFPSLLAPSLVLLLPPQQQTMKLLGPQSPALPRIVVERVVYFVATSPSASLNAARVCKAWKRLFLRYCIKPTKTHP
ncbi:hypothetical protein Pelo_16630 [Pelomyxa schiedti]|nr:hypothetical protein Pelo_16630 [Pelomyxa schiedti]